MNRLRILINEDIPSDAELLEYEISKGGFEFDATRVETREGFIAALEQFEPDIIVSDYQLPDFDGMQALLLARERYPFIPFIIATGAMNEETAVDCMKAGADDYVLKDHLRRIGPAIEAAMDKKRELEEKRLTEQRLESSERKFRAIFEHANDAILLLDDNVFIDCNPMAEKMFGMSRNDLLFLAPFDVSPVVQENGVSSREAAEAMILATLRGAPQTFEWRHRKADGTSFDVDIGLSLVEIDDKPLVLAVLRDITEKKLTERALRDSEEKYKQVSQEFNTLLDAIPDTILLQSPELEIVWANSAAWKNIRDSGHGPEERHCFKVIHGTSHPDEKCPVLECFRTGVPVKSTLSVRGENTWEVRAVPVRNERGDLKNVIEICRDITEIKKLEQQLFHAQKMEAIGQIASGIAHDFNNIITALIGYGNLVQMKMAEDDPSRHYLEQMLATAERAAELTSGLLDFSRKKEPNLQPMNVNDIIRTSEKFLSSVIGDNVSLQISIPEDPIIAIVDHSHMEQVLINLAANARDAMPEGGTLTVATGRCEIDGDFIRRHGYGDPGSYVRIDVTDTGVGMDENTRLRVLEPFFTTKEEGKGTGLGLSIVYGIVKEHGGYINVSSIQGNGSTFSIYLPLVEGVLRDRKIIPTPKPDGGTETILVAEDDDTMREMLGRFLRDYGYKVLEAADGEEALAVFAAAKDEIRLLILDVLMPKKNGGEVCEAARALRPDIKVLFNSGYPLDVLQNKGMLQEGVNYYLKPISPRELLRKVREVLEQ